MADRSSPTKLYRAGVFLATAFTVAIFIFLVDRNLFSQTEQFQESDFIMTFYVAGRLVGDGRAGELYPAAGARTFVNSPFDKAAHEFLPKLPKQSAGAYMYIPLVAGFFTPFGWLDPNISLLLWQIISVLALLWCCQLLGSITGAPISEMFFLAFSFLPIFLTLWAGQLGLAFGLLPLCLGFSLLVNHRPLAAGLVWSLLLLKPQYFLAAAFVALVLLLRKTYRPFIAMSLGVVGLLLATWLLFGTELTLQWLQSHAVSDAMYWSGQQTVPSHLITGLPANLMIMFPLAQRAAVKWPFYFGAAMLWGVGFYYAIKIAKHESDNLRFLASAMIIGCGLCAITLPHLLYYDLCVLIPAGALLMARSQDSDRRRLAIFGWIVVSAFLVPMLALSSSKLPPLILEVILTALLIVLLWRLSSPPATLARR